MDRAARRKDVLAYCLKLLDQSDPIYAMHAADWYEANEPQDLDGLGQRVRREIEKRRASTSGPSSRAAASTGKDAADANAI